MNENEPATPSPLTRWMQDYRQKVDAITAAIGELSRHLSGPLPSPRSEAEMEQLLRWRMSEFDLAAEPVSPSGNERAARHAAEKIRTQALQLEDAYKQTLGAIEFEAVYAAIRA